VFTHTYYLTKKEKHGNIHSEQQYIQGCKVFIIVYNNKEN